MHLAQTLTNRARHIIWWTVFRVQTIAQSNSRPAQLNAALNSAVSSADQLNISALLDAFVNGAIQVIIFIIIILLLLLFFLYPR